MHVTFRQLHLFLALAERGSITAAARACHVTQPTASMQLKDPAEAAGLGLAVLSRHALQPGTAADIVAVLNVRGHPVHSNWFVLYPKGKQLSPIAAEFLNHLHAAASRRRAAPL